jgi:polar amino acid transport system permease protein
VRIGLIGIVFALLVGLICAAVQYYKIPIARQIVAVYIEISLNARAAKFLNVFTFDNV